MVGLGGYYPRVLLLLSELLIPDILSSSSIIPVPDSYGRYPGYSPRVRAERAGMWRITPFVGDGNWDYCSNHRVIW